MMPTTKTFQLGKVFWGLALLFAFTIPITQFYGVRILSILVLVSFFVGGLKESAVRFLKLSWDALMFLIVLAIGLSYTESLSTGLRVIETCLSLLALPIVFSRFGDFNKGLLHGLFYSFALGLFVASIICLLNASLHFWTGGTIDVFFFDKLTGVIDSHPTYMAYYLIAVITFGLYLLYYERVKYPPGVIIACIVFFFLVLMLTGGITAFVSMLFILAFFILKYLLGDKSRRETTIFSVVVLMVISMFAFIAISRQGNVPFARNDSWERMVLWESALKANPSLWLGVGTGDYRSVLNEYYVTHSLSRYAAVNYNAHNQFIEIFFSNGIFGLACLIVLLGRPLYLSVRNSDVLGTLIFFPFIIYGMTEVFLGRYQGVVFFALMHQCFMTYFEVRKPIFSLKDA